MTYTSPKDDPAALTLFIEKCCHQTYRDQLPDLADLAHKVERVHAEGPDAPAGPGDLVQRLIGEVEVHMKKEELILFPSLRRGGKAGIEALTNNLTLPEGACGSWGRLCDGLAEFVDDFETHVLLENEVLFPMFEPVA